MNMIEASSNAITEGKLVLSEMISKIEGKEQTAKVIEDNSNPECRVEVLDSNVTGLETKIDGLKRKSDAHDGVLDELRLKIKQIENKSNPVFSDNMPMASITNSITSETRENMRKLMNNLYQEKSLTKRLSNQIRGLEHKVKR